MTGPGNAITTVLITQNEADRIERCVEACRLFSAEILVVDGGSDDDTVATAERLGCRVLENPWPGYAAQRAFGARYATHDWIFWIDADEVVDPQLAAGLREFADGPPSPHAGASMLRVNQFMGRWLTRGAEVKLRLYHRDRCSVTPVLVHEAVACDGPVMRLPGVIWHFGSRSLREATADLNRYTSLEAERAAAGRRPQAWRFLVRPLLRFVQRYVGFRAYRLGWAGLVYAAHWAHWELLREAKVLERKELGEADRHDAVVPGDPTGVRAGPSIRRG